MVETNAGPLLRRAVDEVHAAGSVLGSVRAVAWASPAADRWRVLVEGRRAEVARLGVALEAAAPVLARLDAVLGSVSTGPVAPPWSGDALRSPWAGAGPVGGALLPRAAGDRG